MTMIEKITKIEELISSLREDLDKEEVASPHVYTGAGFQFRFAPTGDKSVAFDMFGEIG